MLNISKLPVLILSTPRTGSSVLGSIIKHKVGQDIEFFNEPDFNMCNDMSRFEEYYKSTDKFILKFHSYNIRYYNNEIIKNLTTSPEVYRISISRKNITEQIASLYIAKTRNEKYHYHSRDELSNYDHDVIDIDLTLLDHCIRGIEMANHHLKNSTIEFDEHIFYEDISDIENTEYLKVPKPNNYEQLCKIIKMYM